MVDWEVAAQTINFLLDLYKFERKQCDRWLRFNTPEFQHGKLSGEGVLPGLVFDLALKLVTILVCRKMEIKLIQKPYGCSLSLISNPTAKFLTVSLLVIISCIVGVI